MRDLAENLAVLDAIRPEVQSAGEANARANGTHATGGEIDLAEYGYPRKILVCINVGTVEAGGEVNIDIESGNATGLLDTTDASLEEMAAVGFQVYEYKPTRRFINIECVVTDADVTFGVVLIMEHCRFGNRGSDD